MKNINSIRSYPMGATQIPTVLKSLFNVISGASIYSKPRNTTNSLKKTTVFFKLHSFRHLKFGFKILGTFVVSPINSISNTDKYWQRLIETFKHAYGHRTNLGDYHFEPEVQEIYENLIDPAFAADIRKLILDNRTFDNMSYYGANFANEEDHGTAHISVLAPNGDAISVTSTINNHFGAKVRSRQTGFILNIL